MAKTPPDTTPDKTAMLLSTDWFLPFWSLVGIDSERARQCFQKGCREVVLQFVGSESNYYLISFSSDRIEQTRQRLMMLARNCKFKNDALSALDALLTNVPDRNQLQKTAWLFRYLHKELMTDAEMDPSTKTILEDTRKKFSFMDDLELQEACLQSRTSWDRYIRNLTPEISDSLANLVSEDFFSASELKYLLKQLTPMRRDQLHARFRALATAKTGLDLERDWSALLS